MEVLNRTTNKWLLCDKCLARLQTDKYWSVPIHNRLWACLFALTMLNVWYCNNNSYSLLPRNSGPTYNRYRTHTYTTYTSPQFASSSTTVARNRKQNMWSSSVKENRNGTWSVNIRVSVLKTPNLWTEGSSIIC